TATHAAADPHDTPVSRLYRGAVGLSSVGWGPRLAPVHCSARVNCPPRGRLARCPTPVQDVAAVHETPNRCTDQANACWIVQPEPFQRSASDPSRDQAMAVHAVLEVHDTADGSSAGTLGWIAHLVPFQCSATNPLFDPTAVQEEAEVQDTDARE